MKIITLFERYNDEVNRRIDAEKIFENSGMKNVSQKLNYGFFPLGSGIFSENHKIENAEIAEGGLMFLGNDFGTISYLEGIKNKSEENNATVRNLSKLNVDFDKCFFTNFYLGLRNDKVNFGTTNLKKTFEFTQEYKDLCSDFFLIQLEFIEPKIVFCLGREVGQILAEKFEVFSKFNLKNSSFKKLYENDDYFVDVDDSTFGKRRFVLIPHPSYAHINWTKSIREKIYLQISNYHVTQSF